MYTFVIHICYTFMLISISYKIQIFNKASVREKPDIRKIYFLFSRGVFIVVVMSRPLLKIAFLKASFSKQALASVLS